MTIIKKGTKEWEALDKATVKYQDRLDYDQLKTDIAASNEGDYVVVNRPHSHKSNLIDGLSRRGLNYKEDYTVRLSSDEAKLELLLISKKDK